jgi:hypothetical protein
MVRVGNVTIGSTLLTGLHQTLPAIVCAEVRGKLSDQLEQLLTSGKDQKHTEK